MDFFKNMGPLELIIILVIVFMVFGVGKLPEVGASIGKAIRSFRESSRPQAEEDEEETPRRKPRKTVKKPSTTNSA